MHSALFFVSLAVCLTSIGLNLFSLRCAADFFSQPEGEDAVSIPPVTVFKSVRGVDDQAYENFSSFCRQDYPVYQILFGVHDPRDPAVALIQRLQKDFPQADIQWIHCDRVMGRNPKVSNLVQMEAKAKHSVFLVCDSDIRVGRGFLHRLVQPLREAGVGAVTCMCHSLSKGFVGTLEALRGATEFCPHVLMAEKLEGIRFGLGSAILVRKEALEKAGGFASIANYLADDFLLGNRIARAGYAVRLSREVVEHDLSMTRVGDLIRRQIRWNRGIRVCRPWGYRGLFFTYGIPLSLLLLWVSHFSVLGWAVLAATWVARLGVAHVIGARFLQDRATRRFLWLVPLQDLLSFGLWCVGLVGNGIHWRGQSFRLRRDGELAVTA